MKKCPDCAEELQDEAHVCRFCEFRLDSPLVGQPGALNLVTGSVSVEVESRRSKFYQITDAEIENYAGLGHGANALLAFFSTFAGFGLGCYSAIIAGATGEQHIRLLIMSAGSAVVSAIFLILWLGALRLQRTYKQQWRDTDVVARAGFFARLFGPRKG